MKKEQKEQLIEEIREQHEMDLVSLLNYLERNIPVDEDTIEETPKQP